MEEKKEFFKNKTLRIILIATVIFAIFLVGISVGATISRYHNNSRNSFSCNRGGEFGDRGARGAKDLRGRGQEAGGCRFNTAARPGANVIPGNNIPNLSPEPTYQIDNNTSTTSIQ